MKALIVLLSLFLVGCSQSNEFATDLREYSINDIHIVVGVGKWDGDNFVIKSYDGNTWDVPKDVPMYEKAITLESFRRVTK